jgi:hypothetical protein
VIYAKPIIPEKFWIVKDENVNIATVEKKEQGTFQVIKSNVKTEVTSVSSVNELFGQDIFANSPKRSDLVKEVHDIDGYTTKVKPYNVQWFDKIPTFTKTQSSEDRYCAGYYGVRFEGGIFFSYNPKLVTLTEKCIEFLGPYKNEMEANINISTKKKEVKTGI